MRSYAQLVDEKDEFVTILHISRLLLSHILENALEANKLLGGGDNQMARAARELYEDIGGPVD